MSKELKLYNSDIVVILDDYDYERAKKHSWSLIRQPKSKQGHRVISHLTRGSTNLGSFILEVKGCDRAVIHKNGDFLDFRRANLQAVSKQKFNRMQGPQNKHNKTSEFKGVCWASDKRSWKARIYVNGRGIHLGYYPTEHEAAQAYNKGALLHFGEGCYLNPLPDRIQTAIC